MRKFFYGFTGKSVGVVVYNGSKSRFAKALVPIITKNLTNDRWYVEPFVGACGLMMNVKHPKRIGNDNNENLIAFWKEFQKGYTPPSDLTSEQYYHIKNNQDLYPKHLIGYVANGCSFGGKFWGGYAKFNHRIGENYILERYNGTMRKLPLIKDVIFNVVSYESFSYPENSVIYCDPPYRGTIKYKDSFDHDKFWEWVRWMSLEHEVYISEYEAPDDFVCIWEKRKQDSLALVKLGEKSPTKTEKLFIMKNNQGNLFCI